MPYSAGVTGSFASGPDLGSLELLVAVAETGSLGQAARRLGISQPAASLRITALERRTGLTLLERSTSGSRLTPAGASLVDWTRPVLDAVTTLHRSIAALRDERSDRLVVAASLTVADHLVPGWVVALHAVLPETAVALRVGNSDVVSGLIRDGEAAIGFVEGPRAPGGLRSRVVGGDKLVVVVPPTHPWARRRRPLTAGELAATPLVLREPGSGTRDALLEAMAAKGLSLTQALELGSTTSIKAAVAAGEGPAVLSQLAVNAELVDGRLVSLDVEGLDLGRRFRAVWRIGTTPNRAAAALVGIAAGSMRDLRSRRNRTAGVA